MKRYASCIAALLGCIMGFCIVHLTAYHMALNDKAAHLGTRGALWQAVFYDFMVGIPASALCGWAAAAITRPALRRDAEEPEETPGASNE